MPRAAALFRLKKKLPAAISTLGQLTETENFFEAALRYKNDGDARLCGL